MRSCGKVWKSRGTKGKVGSPWRVLLQAQQYIAVWLVLSMADDVESALLATVNSKAKPPENPMSADRVKWEHIHRVFELCNRNVSETARRLKMHRRTLQRILSKKSPR